MNLSLKVERTHPTDACGYAPGVPRVLALTDMGENFVDDLFEAYSFQVKVPQRKSVNHKTATVRYSCTVGSTRT